MGGLHHVVSGLKFVRTLGLGALVAGCGSARSTPAATPAAPWSAARDVLELGRVWTGASKGCERLATEPPNGAPPSAEIPGLRRWECRVPEWNSVVVSESPETPDWRRLEARTEQPLLCDPARFSERVEVVGGMTGNIVSTSVASLEDAAWAGACLSVTRYWVAPGGCTIAITAPKSNTRANGATVRSGCETPF